VTLLRLTDDFFMSKGQIIERSISRAAISLGTYSKMLPGHGHEYKVCATEHPSTELFDHRDPCGGNIDTALAAIVAR